MFFETPSAGAPPFRLTSSATSLQDAPHLSASRHLPRYRGSLPRFNGGIHLHQAGRGQDQDDKEGFALKALPSFRPVRRADRDKKTALGMAGVIPQFRRKIKMPGDFYLLPVFDQYDIF